MFLENLPNGVILLSLHHLVDFRVCFIPRMATSVQHVYLDLIDKAITPEFKMIPTAVRFLENLPNGVILLLLHHLVDFRD